MLAVGVAVIVLKVQVRSKQGSVLPKSVVREEDLLNEEPGRVKGGCHEKRRT